MATETTYYKLKKPDAEEYYDVADQNGNMDKIDAALKFHAHCVDIAVSIPLGAWKKVGGAADGYVCYADAVNDMISLSHLPYVTLDKSCLETACACGLCPTVETPAEGTLRFFAAKIPGGTLSGTCRLWTQGGEGGGVSGGGEGGAVYALPVATATTLGGVKIGAGIEVSADGTITPDTMTETEIQNMIGGN